MIMIVMNSNTVDVIAEGFFYYAFKIQMEKSSVRLK